MTEMTAKSNIQNRTRDYAVEIIKFVNYLKLKRIDYPLRDQILRSGTSIGANIREASASSSKKEFVRFYEVALRSANETDYWLDLINEVYHFEEETKKNIQELKEIRKIIASIILKIKSKMYLSFILNLYSKVTYIVK
jgi:four helix bundle protein